MNTETREITLEPADNARLLGLCGPFDDNIKQLERRLGIEINRRDNHFKLTGRPICVNAAADILRSLYVDTAPMRGQINDIKPEQIHLAIKEARVLEQSAESVPEYGKAINIKTKRGVIKPRNGPAYRNHPAIYDPRTRRHPNPDIPRSILFDSAGGESAGDGEARCGSCRDS